MNFNGKSMTYTPTLSVQGVVSLRRFAWGLKLPMTKALEYVIEKMPKIIDSNKVCESCRDKTLCKLCVFKEGTYNETKEG